MFEADRARQRQRVVLGVLATEVAAENQHAFVVAFAAHLRFAFDVDDATAPHECLRRDARWLAETKIAHLINRQAIDLSDCRAINVDQQGSFGNQFL